MTRGAIDALEGAGQMPAEFLRRHQTGHWGELCEADKRKNVRLSQTGQLFISHVTTPPIFYLADDNLIGLRFIISRQIRAEIICGEKRHRQLNSIFK